MSADSGMDDDRPITLNEACVAFGGTLTPATLRAEAKRGRLEIYKIGRRYYTTIADVKNMVQACRVNHQVHGSTSTNHEEHGPSETERAQSARHALNQTVQRLKKGLPIT
jgi:hypothetical protein